MLRHRTLLLPWTLWLVTAPLLAHDVPRDHDITIEDYFTLSVIDDVAAAPHGTYVAYVERRWDKELDGRNADIWLVHCDTRELRRLTFDSAADTSPVWGAESQHIYFASARTRAGDRDPAYSGKKQVWVVSAAGGEAQPVTRLKDGIELFRLGHDGQTLYYTTSREEELPAWKELREKHPTVQYGSGKYRVSELWKLDLQTWRAEKLVDEKRYIRDFAVTQDQRRIAMITTPDDRLITNEGRTRVDVYDARLRRIETLPEALWRAEAPSPYGWLENPAWAPDGRALAFTISFDGFPAEIIIAEWRQIDPERPDDPVPPAKTWWLKRPREVYVLGSLKWRNEGRELCFLADERARARVQCVREIRDGQQGDSLEMTPGDVVVSAYDLRGTGVQAAVVLGNTLVPQDVFLARVLTPREGEPTPEYRRLTNVNPQTERWKLPQISLVQWRSTDGVEVEGVLELPPDHEPGNPLPLVVELHGGPTGSTPFCLQYWIYGRTLLPARGYALLSPNYRGSTGYGDKFLTDLIGRECDVEVQDILSGVEAMVERGVADPNRMAVMGWSNGGFLTNCIITQSDRFKAASSGAGVVDQVMQWGIQDTPGHNINYMQGLPWSSTEAYHRASPSLRLDRVSAATLIHCGEDDERVPVQHSRLLFRALSEYGKAPTQLLVYPGQGHGLTTYKFRQAKMEWDLKWFDQYVRGLPEE
jgi:dipeptidyl aminopeptidase/acylaminoacyl peptidase